MNDQNDVSVVFVECSSRREARIAERVEKRVSGFGRRKREVGEAERRWWRRRMGERRVRSERVMREMRRWRVVVRSGCGKLREEGGRVDPVCVLACFVVVVYERILVGTRREGTRAHRYSLRLPTQLERT